MLNHCRLKFPVLSLVLFIILNINGLYFYIMKNKIRDSHFIVCGASSGFGRAVAEALLKGKAMVTGIARRADKLEEIKADWPGTFRPLVADLFSKNGVQQVLEKLENEAVAGIVLNAGGPPVGRASDTELSAFDAAYHSVFRWKTGLVQSLLPGLISRKYGRILFIESQSLKQPIPNLVLSNSMRLAVAGFAKTLALETAADGVTVNILAPGSHNTPAIERIIQAKSKSTGMSERQVRDEMEKSIPVGRFGSAEELASLAVWLLSPASSFVTGQVFGHDGGNVSYVFG